MDRLGEMSKPSKRISITEMECNGVRAELYKLKENKVDDTIILYFHGGGYIVGSPLSHRNLTTRLVLKTGMPLLSVDYRLAPEHIFPAQLDDAMASYKWLLDEGFKPEKITIGGDSAGGNLALATIHKIIKEKLPVPGAGVCLSPFTDMLATGESVRENRRKDPMLPEKRLHELAEIYAPGQDHKDPLISPLYGDFKKFPPMYFTAGSTEILKDDTLRIVDKLKKDGIDVTCVIRKNMPHVYPAIASLLPEGKIAIKEISEFLKEKITATNS